MSNKGNDAIRTDMEAITSELFLKVINKINKKNDKSNPTEKDVAILQRVIAATELVFNGIDRSASGAAATADQQQQQQHPETTAMDKSKNNSSNNDNDDRKKKSKQEKGKDKVEQWRSAQSSRKANSNDDSEKQLSDEQQKRQCHDDVAEKIKIIFDKTKGELSKMYSDAEGRGNAATAEDRLDDPPPPPPPPPQPAVRNPQPPRDRRTQMKIRERTESSPNLPSTPDEKPSTSRSSSSSTTTSVTPSSSSSSSARSDQDGFLLELDPMESDISTFTGTYTTNPPSSKPYQRSRKGRRTTGVRRSSSKEQQQTPQQDRRDDDNGADGRRHTHADDVAAAGAIRNDNNTMGVILEQQDVSHTVTNHDEKNRVTNTTSTRIHYSYSKETVPLDPNCRRHHHRQRLSDMRPPQQQQQQRWPLTNTTPSAGGSPPRNDERRAAEAATDILLSGGSFESAVKSVFSVLEDDIFLPNNDDVDDDARDDYENRTTAGGSRTVISSFYPYSVNYASICSASHRHERYQIEDNVEYISQKYDDDDVMTRHRCKVESGGDYFEVQDVTTPQQDEFHRLRLLRRRNDDDAPPKQPQRKRNLPRGWTISSVRAANYILEHDNKSRDVAEKVLSELLSSGSKDRYLDKIGTAAEVVSIVLEAGCDEDIASATAFIFLKECDLTKEIDS